MQYAYLKKSKAAIKVSHIISFCNIRKKVAYVILKSISISVPEEMFSTFLDFARTELAFRNLEIF